MAPLRTHPKAAARSSRASRSMTLSLGIAASLLGVGCSSSKEAGSAVGEPSSGATSGASASTTGHGEDTSGPRDATSAASSETSSPSSSSLGPSSAEESATTGAGAESSGVGENDSATSASMGEPTPSSGGADTGGEGNPDDYAVRDEGPSTSSARLTARPVGTTSAKLGYWEYLPPTYGTAPAPLLVFTHGANWQGSGSAADLEKLFTVGPVMLAHEDRWPDSRPFVVLSPQNSHSGCFTSEDISDFYDHALATYDIDRSRIYHTGQSCGSIGTWNYLADHTNELVTAAVVISGDGRDAFAKAGCSLGKVAIWALHNEFDPVPLVGNQQPIESLLQCVPVPDVKLTVFPGETEHDAWSKTYDLSAGLDIYRWLLDHVHP